MRVLRIFGGIVLFVAITIATLWCVLAISHAPIGPPWGLEVLAALFSLIGVGAVLSLWPATSGRYPPAAHLTAWGILVTLQVLAAIWYVLPSRALAQQSRVQAERQS